MLELRVVLATVQRTRFLPRGVEQPMDGELPRQDPGPEAADQGAPWRSCTGLERGMLLLIFNDARLKLGLTAVLDGSHDGAAAVPLQQLPPGDVQSHATTSLLERLTADISDREAPRMRPSEWGSEGDDKIKVLSQDDFDRCIGIHVIRKGVEPALTVSPVKEQLTIFLKKMFPEGIDRTIAKSPDANFPALDVALFQPLKRKRSRADKLHPTQK